MKRVVISGVNALRVANLVQTETLTAEVLTSREISGNIDQVHVLVLVLATTNVSHSVYEIARARNLGFNGRLIALYEGDCSTEEVGNFYRAGADTCVSFKYVALLPAIVHAAAREWTVSSHALLRYGNLTIDTGAMQVLVGGEVVHLTPVMYQLLDVLASRQGTALSRATLLDCVPSMHSDYEQTVAVHIARLRRLLKEYKVSGCKISTVRGYGYRLDAM